MLPRRQRLPLRLLPDFFPSSRWVITPLGKLFYRRVEGEPTQVASVVSKSTAHLATDRNLIKRRLSEAWHEALKEFLAEGWQLALVANRAALKIPLEEMVEKLSASLKKLSE